MINVERNSMPVVVAASSYRKSIVVEGSFFKPTTLAFVFFVSIKFPILTTLKLEALRG